MDIINIAGFVLTILGMIFTIYQTVRIKSLSKATLEAALSTKSKISNNILLSDFSYATKLIEEVQSYVRLNKTESAYLRVVDLISSVIQIRQLIRTDEEKTIAMNEYVSQLSIIRDELESVNQTNKPSLNKVATNRKLSELHTLLLEYSAVVKFEVKHEVAK